jgi:hypothetical protein
MKTLRLESGWALAAIVDDTNHLHLYISNNDKSAVYEADSDPAQAKDREYVVELTTEFIEKVYSENLA